MNISDKLIMKQADAMSQNDLKEVGYNILILMTDILGDGMRTGS